jgi:gamma-glutamyl-gamma-aminobutyrate hydrolase PuuD
MSGTNFIEATVSQNCQLNGCDLTNCLLFESKKAFLISGGKEHVITKPIIGLLWSLETPGLTATKLNRSLRTNDAIPMKYNYLPIDIDTNQLDEEVKNNLKEMKKIRDPSALSIPARLLERSKTAPSVNPQIFKLQNHAKNLLNHVDCLLLPGGSDIQPEMYGKKKKTSDRHVLESDYRRTILEFALLDEARIKGIPCMGICRGSQMGNIFYGGDLQQHVPGQTFRIQTYQAEPAKKSTGQGIIRGAMKRRAVKGVTMHHQANRRVGKELEAVIVHREKKIIKVNGKKVVRTMRIPKALENKRGAPLILMQFHPEFKGDTGNWEGKFIDYQLSEANKGFFQGFIEAANAYRKKKEVLEEIKTFQLNRFVLAKQKIEQGGELKDLKKFGAVRGIVQDETVEKVRKVFSSLDVPRSRESAQVPKSPDYEANNWDIDWENSDLQSLQQKKKLKQD